MAIKIQVENLINSSKQNNYRKCANVSVKGYKDFFRLLNTGSQVGREWEKWRGLCGARVGDTHGETCACTPTRAPPTMPTPIHASFYSSNLCGKRKRTLHLLAMSIRIRAAACSPQYCNSGFQTFGARATTGAERYSLARVVAWLKKIK